MGGSARWWDTEIDELFVVGPELPAGARRAVCSVLDSLLGELDPRRARTATALRRTLSAVALDVRVEQRDHVIGIRVAS